MVNLIGQKFDINLGLFLTRRLKKKFFLLKFEILDF